VDKKLVTQVGKDLGLLARRAGAEVLKCYGNSRIATEKGHGDFACEADLASEKLILATLAKKYPEVPVLAEESGGLTRWWEAEYCFAIDPLDGTKNFHFGFPYFGVSLALLHYGQPVVAAVHAPLTKRLFTAVLDGGAYMTTGRGVPQKMRVSKTAKLSEAFGICEIPRKLGNPKSYASDIAKFATITSKIRRMRAFAAAAMDLANVARGAADAYLDFSGSTKIWDIAAGVLLVREAGGCVTAIATPQNAPSSIAAVMGSNAALHSDLKKILKLDKNTDPSLYRRLSR
jgi:myo-inositol-1(or 4)-monophosphatase